MEQTEQDSGTPPGRRLDGRKLAVLGVAAAVLVAAAFAAVFAYKGHRKKQDETAILAAVGDSTNVLREALGGKVPADAVARLDAHVKAIKAAERSPLADAAEDYVLGAREIARRSAEAARFAPPAAAARRALAAHLGAGGRRNDGWFRRAGELKKQVENAHFELNVALKALDGLLDGMQESLKRMAPLVGDRMLVEAELLNAARARAREELKRSADELERARQVPTSS
jgi:hypothetical protein